MALAEYDHMVETLAAGRADESFHVRILPRRSRSGDDLLNVKSRDSSFEHIAVYGISVAKQIAWRRVPRERLDDLLRCPLGGGMFRDIGMNDVTSLMRQDHTHVQQLECRRGDDEEVDGRERADVI